MLTTPKSYGLVQTVGSPLLRHFYLPNYFLHVLVEILFVFLRHGHLDLRLSTCLPVLGFVATGSPFPHRNVPFLPGCIPSVVHMLIMMLSMRFPTTSLIDITRSLFRFTSKILSCHSLCKMIPTPCLVVDTPLYIVDLVSFSNFSCFVSFPFRFLYAGYHTPSLEHLSNFSAFSCHCSYVDG